LLLAGAAVGLPGDAPGVSPRVRVSVDGLSPCLAADNGLTLSTRVRVRVARTLLSRLGLTRGSG